MRILLYILVSTFISLIGATQTITEVSGTVIDKEFDETVPFVSIKFVGVDQNFKSDIDGNFYAITDKKVDSMEFSFMGYKPTRIAIPYGKKTKNLKVELLTEATQLEEVLIVKQENPAYQVIRNVVANKDKNDMSQLDAYQYEVYSKVQFDIDNISQSFKERKVTKNLSEDIEGLKPIIDEDGKEVYTMFISESLTDTYFKNNPQSKKDIVKASRVKGVGITDGSLSSQLVGSSMILVNLYDNSMTIMDKEFISPITNNWKSYYHYGIMDTVSLDGFECIEINVTPKRPQDLAFKGTIWIAYSDSSWALKKVDLAITGEANINFIEKIKVQMEWTPTSAGPWMFKKTRYVFDVDELSKHVAGMIVRSTSHYKDIIVNQPKEREFYEHQIELGDNIQMEDEAFWVERRHVEMDSLETQSFQMVDSIQELPSVKSYLDFLDIFINGHYDLGPIELGPYIKTYAFNSIEGHRLRLGFRTTADFSKKVVFKAYLAYGTLDERFKHKVSLKLIPSKSPWTEINIRSYKDIDLLGVTDQVPEGSLLNIASKWGNQIGAYWNQENKISFSRQVNNSFSHEIGFRHRYINPLFNFSYYENDNSTTHSTLTTSEILFQARYARNEKFLINDNSRLSLGTGTFPVFTLNYTAGLSDFLASDFAYHKLDLTVNGKIGMGAWGRTKYWLRSGKIFGTLPYPILTPHLGNQTPFYTVMGFNMMNYFEFVSDQYVSFIFNHHFDGFIMNKIPLARKAKLRTVISAHAVYGSVSKENYNIIPDHVGIQKFSSFDKLPYVEVGYGIENILRVISVQFFHRLTYLDRPNIQKIGLKASVQFSL